MKVTEKQIALWILLYLKSKYAKMVLSRNPDRMLIHRLQCDRYNESGIKVSDRWIKFINENLSNFESCTDFKSILDKVEKYAKDFYGIGELTIYDTTTCIGCPKNIFPDVVYIHAGTTFGANALGVKGKKANKEQFVAICESFKCLEPIQIEDFLCIFKKQLMGESTEQPKGCE